MTNLKIGTFNVENIKSNYRYVRELLTHCDVLCLQEHWLFTYEKQIISDLFPEYRSIIRCCDHDEQTINPYHNRGHAGVAIIWKKSIDRCIEPLDSDGGNRNLAITIKCKDGLLTVINSYLPSGSSAKEIQEYQETLDEVYEMTAKFLPVGNILWMGDLNGSLHVKRHKRDKLLQQFCSDAKYNPVSEVKTPSFYHNANTSTSRIDHILQPTDQRSMVKHVHIHQREPANLSTHDPLIAQLGDIIKISNIRNPSKNVNIKQLPHKINWTKVNLEQYKLKTEQESVLLLEKLHSDNDVETVLEDLNDRLHKIAVQCSPPLSKNKRLSRSLPWHPDLKPLLTAVKQTYWAWKQAGRPSDKTHVTAEARRKTQRALRSKQRQLLAKQRQELLAQIMSASSRDTALFYKLIGRQRGSHCNPDCMQFGDNEVMEDGLLVAWKDYFQQLATPNEKYDYDKDHKTSIESSIDQM